MLASQPDSSPAPQESPAEQHREKHPKSSLSAVEWGILVARIKAGEDAGMEQLYKLFSRGIRYYLCRQLGPQELEDRVHDTFLIVVNAIRRGDLREPERLMGFVRTVVRRQVA
ncbi:MAG TPA: sigma-70 family RNA polymerase sigma factor, partial [Bryobacteraceae bacterium]